jgi:hypothetical protein
LRVPKPRPDPQHRAHRDRLRAATRRLQRPIRVPSEARARTGAMFAAQRASLTRLRRHHRDLDTGLVLTHPMRRMARSIVQDTKEPRVNDPRQVWSSPSPDDRPSRGVGAARYRPTDRIRQTTASATKARPVSDSVMKPRPARWRQTGPCPSLHAIEGLEHPRQLPSPVPEGRQVHARRGSSRGPSSAPAAWGYIGVKYVGYQNRIYDFCQKAPYELKASSNFDRP